MNTKRKIDYKRVLFAMFVMAVGMLMFIVPTYAAISAKTVMTKLISLMCSMFKYVGVALFVWAVIQFILATKRSDADSKGDAVQTGVCGIALMAVAAIANAMGLSDSGVVDEGGITDDVLDSGT